MMKNVSLFFFMGVSCFYPYVHGNDQPTRRVLLDNAQLQLVQQKLKFTLPKKLKFTLPTVKDCCKIFIFLLVVSCLWFMRKKKSDPIALIRKAIRAELANFSGKDLAQEKADHIKRAIRERDSNLLEALVTEAFFATSSPIVNPNIQLPSDPSLLDYILEIQFSYPLKEVVLAGECDENFDLLKILVKSGASLLQQDHEGNTVLHIAVLGGKAKFVAFLVGLPTNNFLFTRNKNGLTPIHLVAKITNEKRRNEIAIILMEAMEQHSQITKKIPLSDYDGRTPILYFAENDRLDLVELLLQRDYFSDVEQTDNAGNSLAHLLAKSRIDEQDVNNQLLLERIVSQLSQYQEFFDKPNKEGERPVQIACENYNSFVLSLLLELNLIPKDRHYTNDDTVAHIIARSFYDLQAKSLLEKLLEHGFPIDQQNDDLQTVLHIAASNKMYDLAKCITDYAPDMREKADFRYNFPMHIAAAQRNSDALCKLLYAEGIANTQNLDGETPTDLLEKKPFFRRLTDSTIRFFEKACEASSYEN